MGLSGCPHARVREREKKKRKERKRTNADGTAEPNARFVHLGPVRQWTLRSPAQLRRDGERYAEEAVDSGHAEAEVVCVLSHDTVYPQKDTQDILW